MHPAVQPRCAMKQALTALVLTLLVNGCNQPLETAYLQQPIFSTTELQQMRITSAVNMQSMLLEKHLLRASGELDNPYRPAMKLDLNTCWNDLNCQYSLSETGLPRQSFPAQAMVYSWWITRPTEVSTTPVCGIRFINDKKTEYELRNFDNMAELAAVPGFSLTHYQNCGACSGLQDLAIYGSLDLTIMAKTCSKRLDLGAKKACMQEIGFTEYCAAAWAYNAQQTAQSCFLVCIGEYGLLPLLTGTESVPPTNGQGELNACLLCDERMSGPGFQYGAGRTRRNSGIVSEIERAETEIYSVPHHYF